MREVDNVFIIKSVHSNLEINKPFLKSMGLIRAEDFKRRLKKGKRIGPHDSGISCIDLLRSAYKETHNPRKISGMQKYRLHEALVLEEITKQGEENPFYNKIPVFVNGLCAGSGVDPYSNSHAFSTRLIDVLEQTRFPLEFLDLFRFIYVQPVTYIQKPVLSPKKGFGLEDILKQRIREEIEPQLRGIGFGTLEKYEDVTRKKGNSVFSPSLLSTRPTERTLAKAPELLREEVTFEGKINLPLFLKKREYEVFVNTQILALKFGKILDSISPCVRGTLKKYDLGGIPLYMEKTSTSAKIMQNAKKYYSEQSVPLKIIGGTGGILENAPEKVPLEGIAHPSALGKLLGLIINLYNQWAEKKKSISVKKSISIMSVIIPRSQKQKPLRTDVTREFPFLLLEEGTKYKHPNLHDLARKILSPYEISLIRSFAEKNRLGFSRIEPGIVSLLNNDRQVYHGFRNMSKDNTVWSSELKDKKVLTPDMIPGFLEMKAIIYKPFKRTDFRGSESAAGTTPRITQKWLDTPIEKKYLGCAIEKLIFRLYDEQKTRILKEQIPYESEEDKNKIKEFCDKEFNFLPSIIGTAVHKISSQPLEGLAHYETLALAGLEPKPSDKYAEIPFYYKIRIPESYGIREISTSIRPDAHLFLEKSRGVYDIIIIDIKTGSVKEYPQPKYLQQTLFYGWVIEQIAKHELGIDIENIYAVFNQSAFFRYFAGEKKIIPHKTFRTQKFSPVTLFTPEHPLRRMIPEIVEKIVDEKNMLRTKPELILDYKDRMENEVRVCKKKCFLSTKIICDYFIRKYQEGKDISELFNIN